MEFPFVMTGCAAPSAFARTEQMARLKDHIEKALDIVDHLGLPMTGIHIDQALQSLVHETGN
ncbi:hypothetical protein OVA07_00570 [Novosphingobium sp. SL115]|uniref:hypothetical protein n=1 Tax=Novosphingobium sp. SL115 TaxID=2995150 RepID=UPI0022739317|nr:hypothetical protein [Novosphingobium sp. SL115]MCY1669506.1 hypothetical protein [Novosphingobium sp. SL115]